MKSFVKAFFGLGIIVVILGGSISCTGVGKPAAAIDYYTLEYPPPISAGTFENLPATIRLVRFQVSPLYNSNKMVYRDKSFARNEYYYRQWRGNPGDTIRYLLLRDLRNASVFKAVFSHEEGFSCDYLLSGAVDEFYEHDAPGGWEAVLAVTIALIKENEPDVVKRIAFQKSYGSRKACLQKNPKGLSEAMSLAMADISTNIIEDIAQALSKAQ